MYPVNQTRLTVAFPCQLTLNNALTEAGIEEPVVIDAVAQKLMSLWDEDEKNGHIKELQELVWDWEDERWLKQRRAATDAELPLP